MDGRIIHLDDLLFINSPFPCAPEMGLPALGARYLFSRDWVAVRLRLHVDGKRISIFQSLPFPGRLFNYRYSSSGRVHRAGQKIALP